jgi:hypothetical protein
MKTGNRSTVPCSGPKFAFAGLATCCGSSPSESRTSAASPAVFPPGTLQRSIVSRFPISPPVSVSTTSSPSKPTERTSDESSRRSGGSPTSGMPPKTSRTNLPHNREQVPTPACCRTLSQILSQTLNEIEGSAVEGSTAQRSLSKRPSVHPTQPSTASRKSTSKNRPARSVEPSEGRQVRGRPATPRRASQTNLPTRQHGVYLP